MKFVTKEMPFPVQLLSLQTKPEAPSSRTYEDLTKPKTVQEWLSGLGLSEYLALFLRMGCDTMTSVINLTAAQVMKMGIRHPEHRTRLLQSVHELAKQTEYQNIWCGQADTVPKSDVFIEPSPFSVGDGDWVPSGQELLVIVRTGLLACLHQS